MPAAPKCVNRKPPTTAPTIPSTRPSQVLFTSLLATKPAISPSTSHPTTDIAARPALHTAFFQTHPAPNRSCARRLPRSRVHKAALFGLSNAAVLPLASVEATRNTGHMANLVIAAGIVESRFVADQLRRRGRAARPRGCRDEEQGVAPSGVRHSPPWPADGGQATIPTSVCWVWWERGTSGGASAAGGAGMLEQVLEWIAQHRAAMVALVVVLALTLLAGRRW